MRTPRPRGRLAAGLVTLGLAAAAAALTLAPAARAGDDRDDVRGAPQRPVAAGRAFYAAVDARPFDPEAVRRLLADDFVDRNRPLGFDGLSDRDTIVTLLTGLAAAFPDGRHQLERVEPVGRDEVLLYWRFTGTHTGEAFLGTPAAGARVDFVGSDLFRLKRGRLAEQRHVEDLLTLARQLQEAR